MTSSPAVAEVNAFSRVSPEHKLRIVRALQKRGEIVAMLGDGVNDAAALKQADVGVAMGLRGTDVAKESAAIVLQDDRFETVAAAVEEGRVIFDNIRKFVFYLFSCNVAEILVLLLASLAALPIPLLPLQLLWLNMVTDTFPALALAVEPGDPSVMRRPPRSPDEAILSRPFLVSIFVYGAGLTAATLGVFCWGLLKHPDDASTLAFMTLALAQIFHLGNARSQEDVLAPARAIANPVAIGAVSLAVLLQLATVFDPLARLLHVTPLSVVQWCVVSRRRRFASAGRPTVQAPPASRLLVENRSPRFPGAGFSPVVRISAQHAEACWLSPLCDGDAAGNLRVPDVAAQVGGSGQQPGRDQCDDECGRQQPWRCVPPPSPSDEQPQAEQAGNTGDDCRDLRRFLMRLDGLFRNAGPVSDDVLGGFSGQEHATSEDCRDD